MSLSGANATRAKRTRSEATEVSGRGLGMGALRAACQRLGGTLHVDSDPDLGTRLEIRVPSASLAVRNGWSAHGHIEREGLAAARQLH